MLFKNILIFLKYLIFLNTIVKNYYVDTIIFLFKSNLKHFNIQKKIKTNISV